MIGFIIWSLFGVFIIGLGIKDMKYLSRIQKKALSAFDRIISCLSFLILSH